MTIVKQALLKAGFVDPREPVAPLNITSMIIDYECGDLGLNGTI